MDYTSIAGLIVLVIWFWVSHVIAKAAARRGRSYWAFWWLSVLISPIITGIIVATIGPVHQTTPTESVTQADQEPDLSKKLKQLGQLKNEGILTDSEFEAKKKDLLDRM